MTAQILNTNYCLLDHSYTYTLRGKVRFRLRNNGPRILIIARSLALGYNLRIARDADSLVSGANAYGTGYEWTTEIFSTATSDLGFPDSPLPPGEFRTEPRPGLEKDVPSNESWIILLPGDQYEFDREFFGPNIPPLDSGALNAGNYLVKFEFPAWDDPRATAEETCQKWNWFGDCYSKEIKTEPAPIVLSPDPHMPNCK